jgi:hypothetical protein
MQDKLSIFYKKYFESKKIKFNYKEFIITINILYSIYDNGCEPPNFILKIPKNDLIKYMKTTIIYYNNSYDKILSFTREPVNIAMNRDYDLEKMSKYFGYKKSLYNDKSSNIAIFTKTPIKFISENYNLSRVEMDINILNVIGVALDCKMQYDYIRLYNLKNINNRILEYENMVRSYFIKIKKCFLDNKFELLFLPGVGLGNFSLLCKKLKIDHHNIFNKIFNETFEDIIKNNISNKKIILWNISYKLSIINYKKINKCDLYLEELLYKIYNNDNYYEFIENNINNRIHASNILFINAYDPYSIVGNGNNKDNSLDGYFGRISAMSVLCWPFTNPFIKYIKV